MGQSGNTQAAIDHAERVGAGLVEAATEERRAVLRHKYVRVVPTKWLMPDGGVSALFVMKSFDLSSTGIRLLSKQVIHTGTRGVALLRKAQGPGALVGLEVTHFGYAHDMLNACGCRFVAIPENLKHVTEAVLRQHSR